MNKKQKKNTQTGITLIALVITIIILLILAMVSIKLVMNSGIITRAESTTQTYSEEQIEEKIKLSVVDAKMLNNGFEVTRKNLIAALNNQLGEGKYIIDEATDSPFLVTVERENYRIYAEGKIEKVKLESINKLEFTVKNYEMTEILNSNKGKTINLNNYIKITPSEHTGEVVWELVSVVNNGSQNLTNKFDSYNLDPKSGMLDIPSDITMVTEKREDDDPVLNPWSTFRFYSIKCYSSENKDIYSTIYVGYSD